MDAERWDARYTGAELVWSAGPNVFVEREVRGIKPGRALDLACGEGRNAIWLAEAGWKTVAIDFSRVAIEKARRLAAAREVDVDWVCADLLTWSPGEDRFDLVVIAYFQVPADERRQVISTAASALDIGGVLVVVAHDSRNLAEGTGGPPDPAVLYSAQDVLDDLGEAGPAFEVQIAETVERRVEGAGRPALDCLVRVGRR